MLVVNADVANATRLHLRCPFRPILNFGTNLRQPESDAPSLKAMRPPYLPKRFVLRALDNLAIETIEARQDSLARRSADQ